MDGDHRKGCPAGGNKSDASSARKAGRKGTQKKVNALRAIDSTQGRDTRRTEGRDTRSIREHTDGTDLGKRMALGILLALVDTVGTRGYIVEQTQSIGGSAKRQGYEHRARHYIRW